MHSGLSRRERAGSGELWPRRVPEPPSAPASRTIFRAAGARGGDAMAIDDGKNVIDDERPRRSTVTGSAVLARTMTQAGRAWRD